MKISQTKLRELLFSKKLITAQDFDKAKKEALKANQDIGDILVEGKFISEDDLKKLEASSLNVGFVDLRKTEIPKDILFLIPEATARKYKVIAYKKEKDTLFLAMLDPEDLQTIEFIKKKTGLKIVANLTSLTSIRYALDQYRLGLRAQFDEIIKKNIETARGKITSQVLEKQAADLPIIRIVDTLLDYAVSEKASDIHIEPLEKEVVVRYRIDGILRDVMTLPKAILPGIVARIKVLSNLKIDEHRLPQDGRFKKETEEYKYAFRVSIMPVFNGEKVVTRLLEESGRGFTLEQLGFQHSLLEKVLRNFKKPQGMILVCGPTGSGKTTTLYTMMNILNTPGVNICTMEDPIEYRIPRINQTQVKPRIGLTFANGLRSLLRQDPDILMVGEIRDKETAELAIHAAMTGHLVLSTLHTNDAAGALPRLLDMGIDPYLAASTVNAIIAQRLVRIICTNCIKSYNLTKSGLTDLEKEIDLDSTLKAMEKEGIIAPSPKTKVSKMNFYKGAGCRKCSGEGYKGRIGIYEILEVTDKVADLIMKRSPAETFLKEAREEQGMVTMIQDGFMKAKTGITTLEEVFRVTME